MVTKAWLTPTPLQESLLRPGQDLGGTSPAGILANPVG